MNRYVAALVREMEIVATISNPKPFSSAAARRRF
jgi:hypothetical protein